MPTLHVTEMAGMGRQQGVWIAAEQPAVAYQEVAIGAASAQSAAFSPTTRVIRVNADAACHIKIGSDPEAAKSGTPTQRILANTEYYIRADPGSKIAVIED